MSQRERLHRGCKSRKQPLVLNSDKSESSGPVTGLSAVGHSPTPSSDNSLPEYSSATPASCTTVCSDTSVTDSLAQSDRAIVSDISPPQLVSPVTVRHKSVSVSSRPCVDNILSDFRSTGFDILGEPVDSDNTLRYSGSVSDCEMAENQPPVVMSQSQFSQLLASFQPRRGASSVSDGDEFHVSEMSRDVRDLGHYKDDMDIGAYIRKLEADLTDFGCPRLKWKMVLFSKIRTKKALDAISGLGREDCDYDRLRETLIKSLGAGRVALGAKLTSSFAHDTRSMSPLETYSHLKVLMESIQATCTSMDDLALFVMSATYRASRSPTQRTLMDQCKISSIHDLHDFAMSINPTGSDGTSGADRHSRSNRSVGPVECFKCHKLGHRAHECRSNVSRPINSFNSRQPSIICYTCQEPGHKSPDCPTKKSDNYGNSSDGRSISGNKAGVRNRKTYNTHWVSVQNGAPHVSGFVNGTQCKIVPDTGAEISIVPGCLVFDDQLTGEMVVVKGWDGRPVNLETAVVDFTFKGRTFASRVAVAPKDNLNGAVLFAVPMEVDTAENLMLDAASKSVSGLGVGQLRDTRSIQPSSQEDACSGSLVEEASAPSSTLAAIQDETKNVRVVTRSMSKSFRENELNENVVHESEAKPQLYDDSNSEFERLAAIDVSYAPPEVGDGHVDRVAFGDELLEVSGVLEGGAGVVCADSDGHFGNSKPQPGVDTPPQSCSSPADELQLAPPELAEGVDSLKQALAVDESLSKHRDLGNKDLNGYSYKDGLLVHTVLMDDSPVTRIVVPKCYRDKILTLAHDKSSHNGVRGMRSLIGRRFTWPNVHSDIVSYVKSCDVCLRVNSAGNKKSKMIERHIVCVPFESVCVDLVGPLPKGRRGAKYLFTYVCLASRWPDAIPMRSASATEAAQCFLEIISRYGIPLRVLSDRGTIFLSKLMAGICETLGIDTIATSPYRPQSNGVVERLHGSLKPMLSKAVDSGSDWVDFLPLALFALRQVPNRDVGYSPHCIVYGRDVLGPLDILYKGWVDRDFEMMGVDDWLLSLNDRLAVIHDLAVSNQSESSSKRALAFNKHKSDSPLEIGSLVLMRIPGMKAALQAAWDGPYRVVERPSKVSYKIRKGDDHPVRLSHRDNLKVYTPRPLSVGSVTLVAEEQGIPDDLLSSKVQLGTDKCPGYNQNELNSVLREVSVHFSNTPGLLRAGTCHILLADGAAPVSQPPRGWRGPSKPTS